MTTHDSAILEARRQLDAAVAADRQEHTEATGEYRKRCWIRWRRCCGNDAPPPAEMSPELEQAQAAVDEALRVYVQHSSYVTLGVLMEAQKRRNAARAALVEEMKR